MDRMTPEQRHRCMSHIRSKDTSPEWRVRKTAFAMGFRYRLHDKRLPGKPDLVFPRLKKVIFVHGCFWHRHSCQAERPIPETNRVFWEEKFKRNQTRDRQVLAELWKRGWQPLVIWECETRDSALLQRKLSEFLSGTLPAAANYDLIEQHALYSLAAENGE